jgi:hypothetical protein
VKSEGVNRRWVVINPQKNKKRTIRRVTREAVTRELGFGRKRNDVVWVVRKLS